MNKTNVTRSSEFHMDEGDVLHYILIVDGGVTPIIGLVSTGDNDNQNEVPDAVVALEASDITHSSFTANWNFIENATGYYLDVAEDADFTSFVAGYEDLSVGYVNEYGVTGLDDTITYYYRVRAINDVGTGDNSNTVTLTTLNEPIVDFDGNVYTYITIGTQQWMIENLKTEHYADGTAIPNVTLAVDWITEDGTPGHDGAYCYYNNDEATYKEDYGALYNWYATDNAHNLISGQFTVGGVPSLDWRLPSDIDMDTLVTLLGGEGAPGTAGEAMKEIGLLHWLSPNDTMASNSSGFTARGAGERNELAGAFDNIKSYTAFWTSSDVGGGDVVFYDLASGNEHCFRNEFNKKSGFSVRCMRDI